MRRAIYSTAAMAMAIQFAAAAPVVAQERPNIVFIIADDLGWKDVGFAGAEFFETPHIDRLAAQGMKFTAAYSGGPNCAPTRACLLSGTYTPRHQIYTPGGKSKGKTEYMRLLVPSRARQDGKLSRRAARHFPIKNSLSPEFVCIPEVLGSVGYATARLGKWHLGPDNQGFDLSSADGEDDGRGRFYGNVDVAERLTDRARRFIEDNKDGLFFLYLSHWDVHTPRRARKSVVDRYTAKLGKIPEGERRNFDPVYAGMIEAVDTSVGRVVAKIDELGLSKKTIVIFTSDNGGIVKVSQLDPLRSQKGSLFEGGTRVPMCVRWTGRIRAGAVCDTPVTSVDFLPTFARLARAEAPTAQPVDGVDISPLFFGEEIAERSIFWHYPLYLVGPGLTIDLPGGRTYSWRGFPSTSVRRGKWKAIHFFETDTVSLYDLEKDPGEAQDFAENHPDVARRLAREIHEWQRRVDAPVPREPNPDCSLPPLKR